MNLKVKNIDFESVKDSLEIYNLKAVDGFLASALHLILALFAIVANIVLYYFVCENKYGVIGTIGVFAINFVMPLVIVSLISKKEDTTKRHIKLLVCNVVYSILHFILHYDLLKEYLNRQLIVPFLVITSILCFIFFAIKFESTVKLFQQLRNGVMNVCLCYLLFQIVPFTTFLWVTIPLILPILISTVNVDTK